MALNYIGVKITGTAAKDAASEGFTPTPISDFADWEYVRSLTAQTSKVSLDDSDPLVTWAAIIADLDGIGTLLTQDFDSTKTVDSFLDCSKIDLLNIEKYNDGIPEYSYKLKFFVKVS